MNNEIGCFNQLVLIEQIRYEFLNKLLSHCLSLVFGDHHLIFLSWQWIKEHRHSGIAYVFLLVFQIGKNSVKES